MTLRCRPEVWVLLALVAAGLVWVAADQRPKARSNSGSEAADAGMGAGVQDLRLYRTAMVPDGAHRRLRIEFTARHGAAEPLDVRPPAARLLDASGAELPPFFAPGAFPPALPPGTTAASWMEYWLTPAQAEGPLTFQLAGAQIPVPTAK